MSLAWTEGTPDMRKKFNLSSFALAKSTHAVTIHLREVISTLCFVFALPRKHDTKG